jgi:uncharacterized membrane protein HdeD (DUF308 family)
MDPVIEKRINLLYLGGIINAYIGLYVLIERPSAFAFTTALAIGIAFIAFAALDFIMPLYLRRQWRARVEAARARQGGAGAP